MSTRCKNYTKINLLMVIWKEREKKTNFSIRIENKTEFLKNKLCTRKTLDTLQEEVVIQF